MPVPSSGRAQALAVDPSSCPCGRLISDTDPQGCETPSGQRYCLEHLPREANPDLWQAWQDFLAGGRGHPGAEGYCDYCEVEGHTFQTCPRRDTDDPYGGWL